MKQYNKPRKSHPLFGLGFLDRLAAIRFPQSSLSSQSLDKY